MSKPKLIVFALTFVVLCAVGALVYNYYSAFSVCLADLFYSRATAELDLSAARDAAEENAAFDRMWQNSRVAFRLCDAAGNELDMRATGWPPKRTAVIRFYQFGDPPLDHTLIDLKNLRTLMRE